MTAKDADHEVSSTMRIQMRPKGTTDWFNLPDPVASFLSHYHTHPVTARADARAAYAVACKTAKGE